MFGLSTDSKQQQQLQQNKNGGSLLMGDKPVAPSSSLNSKPDISSFDNLSSSKITSSNNFKPVTSSHKPCKIFY